MHRRTFIKQSVIGLAAVGLANELTAQPTTVQNKLILADLQAALYYVNIPSTTYPGGEIRGQFDHAINLIAY